MLNIEQIMFWSFWYKNIFFMYLYNKKVLMRKCWLLMCCYCSFTSWWKFTTAVDRSVWTSTWVQLVCTPRAFVACQRRHRASKVNTFKSLHVLYIFFCWCGCCRWAQGFPFNSLYFVQRKSKFNVQIKKILKRRNIFKMGCIF